MSKIPMLARISSQSGTVRYGPNVALISHMLAPDAIRSKIARMNASIGWLLLLMFGFIASYPFEGATCSREYQRILCVILKFAYTNLSMHIA